MKRKIVFITDCTDVAYSELRAVTLTHLESLGVADTVDIEPVAAVYPFSIINGAFILRLLAEVYPPGTVFSIILNPSQKRPERIIGKTQKKDFIFLGANTGVFEWFLKEFGISELYELHDPGFVPFGGKYVHAPNAARAAAGMNISELGSSFNAENLLGLEAEIGTIIHVDNFGLMKIKMDLDEENFGKTIRLSVNGNLIEAHQGRRMMEYGTGEWVIYPGSSLGYPELGMVRRNGAQILNAAPGDIVRFS